MKDALDILMEARPWIDKGWCQQWLSVDARGRACDTLGGKAVAWCAIGAVTKVTDWPAAGNEALRYLAQAIGKGDATNDIGIWNDDPDRTKEEVLEAYDRAISLALDEASA
jgi:hypothetical protein